MGNKKNTNISSYLSEELKNKYKIKGFKINLGPRVRILIIDDGPSSSGDPTNASEADLNESTDGGLEKPTNATETDLNEPTNHDDANFDKPTEATDGGSDEPTNASDADLNEPTNASDADFEDHTEATDGGLEDPTNACDADLNEPTNHDDGSQKNEQIGQQTRKRHHSEAFERNMGEDEPPTKLACVNTATADLLSLCLKCGEYALGSHSKINYCFFEHMCEKNNTDFGKFGKCISIISDAMTSGHIPLNPDSSDAVITAVARSAPPPPPPPPPAPPAPPAQVQQMQSQEPSYLDELKATLKKRRAAVRYSNESSEADD